MRWIPNSLTAARLVLLLPIMYLLGRGQDGAAYWAAFGLFLAAGATDFLDGWAARRLGCASNIGIFFDPLVDKIFANVLLVDLMVRHPDWIPPWIILLLLAREFAVQGFRSMAPCKGVVLRTGMPNKLKLVFQLLATGTALAGLGWAAAARPLLVATWLLLGLSLAFGYYSMAQLFWRNRDLWARPAVRMEIR
ncbi:MAG: CDP-alcohol phosphatidyltransferase family protein [bacterium]|nr:CDP-alcohol phosphatidyltransferase family protein [bacterium]